MDPNLPAQPVSGTSPNRSLLTLSAIVIILILTSAAYYYFVRQKNLGPTALNPPVSGQVLPDRSLNCPLPTSFCQGHDLYKEGSISAKLNTATPLYAAFTGIAQGFSAKDFTLVSLNSQELKLQAVYYFKGSVPSKKEVKKGEIIASANGQPISSMGGQSFVFVLIQTDKQGKSTAPTNFKQRTP